MLMALVGRVRAAAFESFFHHPTFLNRAQKIFFPVAWFWIRIFRIFRIFMLRALVGRVRAAAFESLFHHPTFLNRAQKTFFPLAKF
jgi:pterin-4a-carbinolamine dehydratase